MANRNSADQDYANNADGWQLGGGTTKRKLTVTGADVTVTGSGANVYTFPASTDTLVSRASTDTLTNKTLTAPTLSNTALAGTPVVGQLEYDGTVLYGTHASNERGTIVAEQSQILSTAYTLTSQTAVQKLFNATTNGAITLATSTTYMFECVFSLSGLSSSTGTVSFGIGGTATFTSAWWESTGGKIANAGAAVCTDSTTLTGVVISASNTVTTGRFRIWGVLRVNAGGTVIPEVGMSIAAAAIVGANSFCRFWPVGINTVTNVGNWS